QERCRIRSARARHQDARVAADERGLAGKRRLDGLTHGAALSLGGLRRAPDALQHAILPVGLSVLLRTYCSKPNFSTKGGTRASSREQRAGIWSSNSG